MPTSSLHDLSVVDLLTAAGQDEVDETFLAALAILTSPKIGALEARAHFRDGGSVVLLSDSEISDALHGRFRDPQTGAQFTDAEDMIFPYFEPSSRFLEARQ